MAEVYVSVSQYTINKYNSIEFLIFTLAKQVPEQTYLPTWVPDWRRWKVGFKYYRDHLYSRTPSSRITELPRVSKCLTTLYVQGFCIDILDRAFREIIGHSFPAMLISNFLKTCAEIVKEAAWRQSGVVLPQDDWLVIFLIPLVEWFDTDTYLGWSASDRGKSRTRKILPEFQRPIADDTRVSVLLQGRSFNK